MAKGRMSYFDRNIQKSNEDFLDNKTVQEIQRDAKKQIFKDMAFGNIDYSKYGNYFMEPRFLEQLIVVSADEFENHQIKYTALREFDMKHPGDRRVCDLCATEGRLAQAYSVINMYLNNIKASNYDISCLTNLITQLYQYRQDIANN